MNITSPEFIGFALIILLIYYFLPWRLQNYLILLASYIFIASFSLQFTIVFFTLTLINYLISRKVEISHPHSRYYLWAGILFNICVLIYFKYNNFFIPYVVYYLKRAGIILSAASLEFLLPIGLSFFILQAISYLLDIRKGLIKPSVSFFSFAVYMVYFPRMISGPIERGRDLLPQFEKKRNVDISAIWRSFTLILIGLVRKLAIADVLTLFIPKTIFQSPSEFSAPALTFWLITYAFMIYNDFAGYTSIVRGISGFFGIELSQNFSTPYFSRNFTEFWQRWHISLSNWLRDYIFTPLTRSLLRKKYNSRHPFTIIVPPLFTMAVSALWHGASWNMLLWGSLHGTYQIVERTFSFFLPLRPQQQRPPWQQFISIFFVFSLAVLAWVPFRMDLPTAFSFWRGMFQLRQWLDFSANFEFSYHLHILTIILILITVFIDLLQYKRGELIFLELPPFVKALFINAAIFLIILGLAARVEAPPPFIYQGF